MDDQHTLAGRFTGKELPMIEFINGSKIQFNNDPELKLSRNDTSYLLTDADFEEDSDTDHRPTDN